MDLHRKSCVFEAVFSILENFFWRQATCLGCGSYFRAAGFLCPVCWNGLVDDWSVLFRSELRLSPTLTVRPLFHWIPGESDLLSKTILAHKGSGHRREWRWAARQCLSVKEGFLPTAVSQMKPHQNLVLVPAPSPSGRGHALEFAQALGEALGLSVVPLLQMGAAPGKQQGRNRRERAKRSLFLSEEFSHFDLANNRVILVDDVVTTGFTAEAARKALGLSQLEVWCLAHRRRLVANPWKC